LPIVANIELREHLIGGGFSGTISPALTWFDQQALQRSAEGSMVSAIELRFLNAGMGRLVDTVVALESALGFRLDAQTRILDSQLDVLERIEHALRRPGQVSAAERISNTGELLRRGRYARALSDAELAIGDDPNNPAGFVAAGWAAIGLGRGDRARELFLEAAEASDGDERDTALRQAARITFALEDGAAALRILEGCDDSSSALQRWATEYDRAVYYAASDDGRERAVEALKRVLAADERFASMVFADEILSRDPAFGELAAAVIRELVDAIEDQQAQLQRDLDATSEALTAYPGPVTSEAESRRDRLAASASTIRDEVASSQAATSLRARLDALSGLSAREVREEAAAWPAWAKATYEEERDALAREAERAAAAAVEQLAMDLENAARRFAAQRGALIQRQKDGSWVITKKKFRSEEAWRAHAEDANISIESIPWASRYQWN